MCPVLLENVATLVRSAEETHLSKKEFVNSDLKKSFPVLSHPFSSLSLSLSIPMDREGARMGSFPILSLPPSPFEAQRRIWESGGGGGGVLSPSEKKHYYYCYAKQRWMLFDEAIFSGLGKAIKKLIFLLVKEEVGGGSGRRRRRRRRRKWRRRRRFRTSRPVAHLWKRCSFSFALL